jgi:DNA polymerase-3 subunit chi
MSCEVWFYHLERTGLDQALPELLQKTLGRGWRALVRSPDPDRLEHLDGWLWSYRDDAFLAHGLDSEPNADRQPVLLTAQSANANASQALFLLDDADPGDLAGYERCLILFDGRDDAATASARKRWSELKGQGNTVSYWRQSPEGRWEKQA